MSSSKKIAVWYEPNRGGESVLTEGVINLLRRKKTCIVFFGGQLKAHNTLAFFAWIVNELSKSWLVLRGKDRFQVVYTPLFTMACMAVVHRYIFGYPRVVWHYHGNRVPDSPFMVRGLKTKLTQLIKFLFSYFLHYFALFGVDVLVVPGKESKKQLQKKFNLLNRSIVVIPNGVDDRLFKPTSLKEKNLHKKALSLSPQTKIITYLGRLDKSKGIARLLKVFKLLSEEQHNLTLIIAYPDSHSVSERLTEKKIITLAAKKKGVVLFKNPSVHQIYAVTDLAISFSTLELASPTLFLLESLFSECLFLTTNSAQKQFLCTFFPNFFISELSSNQQIAKRIRKLLSISKEKKEKYFQVTRDKLKGYTLEENFASIEQLFT